MSHLPRYVVLEGWDRVGKTTLAQYLVTTLGYAYVHLGPPGPDGLDVEVRNALTVPGRFVLDRAWWSEAVYAPLCDRATSSLATVRWHELAAADGVLVHVDCDPTTLQWRLRDQVDPWSRLLPPEQALARVRKILTRTRYPGRRCLRYWTGARPTPRDAYATPGDLHVALRLLSGHNWSIPGLGNPRTAWAALVGERHPRGLRPFEAARSGRYLLRVLERLTWTTDDLYVTNADHPALVDELRWLVLDGRPIVALGRVAEERLRELGVEPRFTYHPQFWQRFKAGHEVEHAEALAEVLGFELATPDP